MEKCQFCGGKIFTAKQELRADVLVDAKGAFYDNFPGGVEANCEAESPYGDFQCIGCGAEYESLENASVLSGPVENWGWSSNHRFHKFMEKGLFQRWDGMGYTVYLRRDKNHSYPYEFHIRSLPDFHGTARPFLAVTRDLADEPGFYNASIFIEFNGYGHKDMEWARKQVKLQENALAAAEAIQTQFVEPIMAGTFNWDAPAEHVPVSYALPSELDALIDDAAKIHGRFWAEAVLRQIDLTDPAKMSAAYTEAQSVFKSKQIPLRCYFLMLQPEMITDMEKGLEAQGLSMSEVSEDMLGCMVSNLLKNKLTGGKEHGE